MLISSAITIGYSQEEPTSSSQDLFVQLLEEASNSKDLNRTLRVQFSEIIETQNVSEKTKTELTAFLLEYHNEHGAYIDFYQNYEQYHILLSNPVVFKYWETVYLERREAYDKMQEAGRSLLKLSKESGDNWEISKAYRLLAKSKMHLNQKDSALYMSNMALNFAKRSNAIKAVSKTFKDLSEIYAHFDMVGKSTSTLLKLNQESERIKDDRMLCWSTMKIAERSYQVKSFDAAITYYRKALNISEKNNLNDYKIDIFGGLAEVFISKKNLKKASDNISKGKLFLNKNQVSTHNLDFMLTTAKYLIEIKSYQKAEVLLIETLQQYEQFGVSNGSGNTQHLIGRIYFEKQKWEKARKAFLGSKSILSKKPYSKYSLGNFKYLAQVYAAQNKFQSAYNNLYEYEKYIENNSSLSSGKAINELTEMYSRELREYRIKDQEQVIKDQQKEKELLSLKGEKQMSTIVLVLIVLLSTIIIVLFYLRQLKIKQTTKEIEMSQTLLRTQMNPHFIFNAMSVIQSSLYENNPAKSSKFLVSFSRLIRLILENSPKEFITLETEIDILEKYLKTQKLRFENRFDYQINVTDDLVFKKVMIPPMITQPFVENSIEHGHLNIIENGKISIDFMEKDGMLYAEIIDNGVGIEEASKKKSSIKNHKSMALDITNSRVEIINKKYKTNASIKISNLSQEKYAGTRVQIYLPLLLENINFDSE